MTASQKKTRRAQQKAQKTSIGEEAASGPDQNGAGTTRRRLIETAIISEASRLFAERGFAGTSLQDVADALGMTRSALYYYVKSKKDILSRLVSEMTEHAATETMAIARDSDRSAADKLAAIARLIARQRAEEPLRFLFLIRSQAALPEDLSATNKAAEREVHRAVVEVLEAGLRTGEFHSLDTRTTALAVVGMCNWIAWWAHTPEPGAADAIAETFADLALAMVTRSDGRVSERPGPLDALQLVREDLALLENTLRDRPANTA